MADKKTKTVKAVAGETDSPAAAVAENVGATTCGMVVYFYPGHRETIAGIWDRLYPSHPEILYVETDGDNPVKDLMADCIADSSISDNFILVPPMALPCAKIRAEELYVPICFVDGKGVEHFSHRLPVVVDKMQAARVLADMAGRPDEETMKEYYSRNLTRAVRVSYGEGNYVTPVLRGNPCFAVVMEALVRKKWLTANATGMAALEGILADTLLKD